MVKRGLLLGKIVYDGPDHLTFEYFLSIEKLVVEYQQRHILTQRPIHAVKRRKALADSQKEDYEWEHYNQKNRELLSYKLLQANLNQTLKCPKSKFMATLEKVNQDKDLQVIYKDTMKEVRDRVTAEWEKNAPFKELSREETLKNYKEL